MPTRSPIPRRRRWPLVALLGALASVATASASETSELLYSRGIVELHRDQPGEALELFNQAVAADPTDGHAFYYRGLARLRLDQLEAAVDDLRRALELLPAESSIALELGLALTEAGRHEEAVDYLRRAAQDRPVRARASMILGLAELRLGNLDAADEAFAVAAANPSLAPRAAFYRGVTAFRRGDWDGAKLHFEATVAGAPGSEIANEARVYLERLRSGEAGRRWSVFAEAGFQYDSNVCLSPDDGCEFLAEEEGIDEVDEEDGRATIAAGGRYTLWQGQAAAVVAGYELFQSLHFDLDEFDLQNHRPDVQLVIRRGALRAGLLSRYDFFLRDGDSFLHEVTAVPWASLDTGEFGRSEFYYRMRYREFAEDSFADRDGLNHAIGIRQVLPIGVSPGSHVAAGLRYDLEDPSSSGAEAQRFAYNGFEINGEGRWVVVADVALTAGYALRYEVYDDVSADFDPDFDDRRDVEHRFRVEVDVPVTPIVSVRGGYYGTVNDSRQAEFDYDRHVVSLSVALRY